VWGGGGEVLLGESVSYYGKSEDRDVVKDLITVCENCAASTAYFIGHDDIDKMVKDGKEWEKMCSSHL
jgi:hypothetical protein